ncbi:hypothetical protein [Candidatus Bandiella euplotis]|nr:hypothetical protein [Candidatus Bandiella woodruffii]
MATLPSSVTKYNSAAAEKDVMATIIFCDELINSKPIDIPTNTR